MPIMITRIPLFDLDDDPPTDAWSMWGVGITIPSLIVLVGISRIVFKSGVLYGTRGRSMPLTGWDAVAFGIAIIAAGLFLHTRYFWSNTSRLLPFAGLGQAVAMLAGILGLGFVIVRNFSLI
jgi:hypothetical protein